MFKCENCGSVFENPEIKKGYLCECGMQSIYESIGVCPNCSCDEYHEAKKCSVCGEYFSETELFGGTCQQCIDEYTFDIDGCYELSQNDNPSIEINGFLATMFSKSQIEDLLLRELKFWNMDCLKYIDADKNYFGELLAEKANNKGE